MTAPQLSLRLAALCLLGSTALAVDAPSSGKVDFTRDIRPLLSDACFHCHGPDEGTRKAKLRLDTREGVFKEHEGTIPVVAKDLGKSEAWLRVISDDPDEVMPPPDSHKKLRPEQKELLKRWIEQGAEYKEHWAFQAPVRPAPPKLSNAWWPKGDLDRFVAAELEKRGLAPNAEAPKEVLLRRVALDLTGLPPTPAEVDTFLADTGPQALEHAVDRYLASPKYGEHMARYWLDAARYADTHGLHLDNERSMWPYRDWVVRAFNSNLPFDQFTVWQLAGDLLPNPTRDQQIASGFNRCNVTTSEGGSINEELLYRYAVDRADTTAGVWMGLTAGCAACHDHKFDPLSQKEFYQLYSFFYSSADPAMDGNKLDTPPVLRLSTPEQEAKIQGFENAKLQAKAEITKLLSTLAYQDPATAEPKPPIRKVENVWVEDGFPAKAKASVAGQPRQWAEVEEGGMVFSGCRALRRTGEGIAQDFFDGVTPWPLPSEGKLFAYVWLDPTNPPKSVMLQWHSEGNWSYRAVWGDPQAITFGSLGSPSRVAMGALPPLGQWTRLEVPLSKFALKPGTALDGVAFTQYGGTVQWDRAGLAYEENPATDPLLSLTAWKAKNQGRDLGATKVPAELRRLFRSVPPDQQKEADKAYLREYFLTEVCTTTKGQFAALVAARDKAEKDREALDTQIVKTFIMQDLPKPRPAFVMLRGQYDKPGDPVEPATPAVFPKLQMPKGKQRATRLELAQWLVAPEHPLTARVTVNRFWQQFMGAGLVTTPNDFGAQGAPPTHPELLDWLAVEFRESGWDVKGLVKKIVLSATYRQDSKVRPEVLEKDPANQYFARGPRFRLDAEVIRDQALYTSGLMDFTMGGRGVRPYQPEKVWEPVGFVGSNTREYVQDHGAALYRRSLYTFWKRTAPPPNMTAFDATAREQFCVRRERSNTPIQALVTLNDVQHYEAARALAQRMMTEGGLLPADRIAYGFRAVVSRHPVEAERKVLEGLLARELERYAKDTAAAKLAISVGESKPKDGLNPSELAAYTLVANTLLNLDEALTKN